MAVERLQKILASSGVASRRASEALIAAGRVTVDGRPAHVGDQVDPSLVRIEVDGRPIGAATAAIHLALHKPAGVTATVRDRHADRTVLQLLPTAMVPDGARLYPVGRLDRDSEGLLLLTNDGDWAERVLHPRYGVEREYAVGLPGWLTNEQRAALDAGIDLEEGRAAFAHPIRPASSVETARLLAVLVPPPADGLAWYRVVLRQGCKRQVRRMFGAVGAPITRLVRVRIGPVRLDDLASGRFRRLRGTETKALGAGRAEPPPKAAPPAAPAPAPRARTPQRTGSGPRVAGTGPRPAGVKPPPPGAAEASRPSHGGRDRAAAAAHWAADRPERPIRGREEATQRPASDRPSRSPRGDRDRAAALEPPAPPDRPARPERPSRGPGHGPGHAGPGRPSTRAGSADHGDPPDRPSHPTGGDRASMPDRPAGPGRATRPGPPKPPRPAR